MGLKPGYKQTEVGVIPEDWRLRPFLSVVRVARGQVDPRLEPYRSMILVAPDHIESGSGRLLKKETAAEQHAISGKYLFSRSDLVYSKIRPYLKKAILADFEGLCSADMYPLKPAADVSAGFILAAILGHHFSKYTESVSVRSGMPKINRAELAEYAMAFPPTKSEQQAIADALSDANVYIESLEQLLAKKRQLKQGAMQELLTGKIRLPGFIRKWDERRIEEIAFPSAEKNLARESLPVLTCSKHAGFVDSLAYFKSQIFSRNTSGYKVIRRGQIGYPANHVEEGSIGLQDLYEVALVSPIYVVFSVGEDVLAYFLHRLLKLDSYRQKFETATTSSVDRRGSLRWPAFSQITVSLPRIDEQTAIAAILSDMEAEILTLNAKLGKARSIRQGMMQELLTGRIRLV
jgi:type I restriction enzyme S subunit